MDSGPPGSFRVKDECDNVFTNPQDISSKFNEFFVNIGPELAANIHNTGKNYSMYFKPIVEMDIIKIINKFNSNKGAGNDNIGNFVIKKVANEIICETSYDDIQFINLNRDCPRNVKDSKGRTNL